MERLQCVYAARLVNAPFGWRTRESNGIQLKC